MPETPNAPALVSTRLPRVSLHRLPLVDDFRGQLSYAEFGVHVPFPVERCFLVFGVPRREVRGGHAHKAQDQFLICVHGRCRVTVDDGRLRDELVLDDPTIGIHVPPMIWASEANESADTVLLVLASARYDPGDYIRDYHDFVLQVRNGQPTT
jgi:dTDP-4-dehydrorhamnose 3,5-epimerase-like enzyme